MYQNIDYAHIALSLRIERNQADIWEIADYFSKTFPDVSTREITMFANQVQKRIWSLDDTYAKLLALQKGIFAR